MPEIGGVSYPDTAKLDEMSVEWGRAADKLDTLATQVAAVDMDWTGRSASYFIEVTTLVWKQVTEVAAAARSISENIKQYSDQVREMIKQAIKAELISIITIVFSFATMWIPGLGALMGRLIDGLAKVLVAVGNLASKVVPTSVRALVTPFTSPKVLSELVVGGSIGATTEVAIAFVAELTASGVTNTDVKIDGKTFGIAAGAGFAAGAVFSGLVTDSKFRGGGFMDRHPFPFTGSRTPKLSSNGVPHTVSGTGEGRPQITGSGDLGEVDVPSTAMTPLPGRVDAESGSHLPTGAGAGLPPVGSPGAGKSSASAQTIPGAGQRAIPRLGRFTDLPEAGVGPGGGVRLSVDGNAVPPARLDNSPPANGSGSPVLGNPPAGAGGRKVIDVNGHSVNEPPPTGQGAPPAASAGGGRTNAGGGPRQPGGAEGVGPGTSRAHQPGQDGVTGNGTAVSPRPQVETAPPVRPGEVPPVPGRVGEVLPGGGRPGEVSPVAGRVGEVLPVAGRVGEVSPVAGRVGEVLPGGGRVGEVLPVAGRVGEVSPVAGRVGEVLPGGGR
ncbi:hypothetical protein ACH4OY_13875, partial [Micromonospora rubida]